MIKTAMSKRVRWLTIRRKVQYILIGVVMLFALLVPGLSNAGDKNPGYASRTITIISPWAAGSSVDIFGRTIAPSLSERLGAPIEVVCKPGGGATIGVLEMMKARNDGYTLLIDCAGSSSLQKAWVADLPYKVEERTYIVRIIDMTTAFFVPGSCPWKSLKDIEEALRKNPEEFRWPSTGNTTADFSLRLLKSAMIARGVDMSKVKTVPFVSAAPATKALAGGHIDIAYMGVPGSRGLLDAKKIRPIAVIAKDRSKHFPGIPTCVEQGFPDVTSCLWLGYSGPPGLPKDVVAKWIDAIKSIIHDPAVLPLFDRAGGEPGFLSGDDFRKYIFDEAETARKLIGE